MTRSCHLGRDSELKVEPFPRGRLAIGVRPGTRKREEPLEADGGECGGVPAIKATLAERGTARIQTRPSQSLEGRLFITPKVVITNLELLECHGLGHDTLFTVKLLYLYGCCSARRPTLPSVTTPLVTARLVDEDQLIRAAIREFIEGTEWAVMHCVKGGMARAENV